MLIESVKLAVKNIKKKRLRSLLTLLGILISVATIFLLISLSLGLRSAIEEQFRLFGTDKFFIQPKGQFGPPGSTRAVELTVEDAKRVEKVTGVKDISYWAVGNTEIKFRDEKRFFVVLGYPLEQDEVFVESGAYKIDEGRLLKEGEKGSIILGSQYKYNNIFKKTPKIGDILEINGKDFKIKGFFKQIGNPGDDRLIYMSLEDLKSTVDIGEIIDAIVVQVGKGEDVKEVAERAEKNLRRFRNQDEDNQDFTVLTPEEFLEVFGTVLNIIAVFLIGVAAISLLVGSIGIANTMFTSVLERTREIGIMKAVGAKNSDIAFIFLIESGILGLIGGIIGVSVGVFAGKIIEYIAVNQLGTTLLKISTPFYLIGGCLLFAFLVGVISGTLPAIRASKTNPVESLRYE